jgi:hypothetical protein
MANKWDEMRTAYKEAEIQVQAADAVADDMARMLKGRLRRVNQYTLCSLKKELEDIYVLQTQDGIYIRFVKCPVLPQKDRRTLVAIKQNRIDKKGGE